MNRHPAEKHAQEKSRTRGPAGARRRMQVSVDGAERLYHLYVKELQESLRAPVEPKVPSHQTQALIRAAERLVLRHD